MVSHNAKGTLSSSFSQRFLAAFGVKTVQKYKILLNHNLFIQVFFKKCTDYTFHCTDFKNAKMRTSARVERNDKLV